VTVAIVIELKGNPCARKVERDVDRRHERHGHEQRTSGGRIPGEQSEHRQNEESRLERCFKRMADVERCRQLGIVWSVHLPESSTSRRRAEYP
jgi:hypothetical protein